MTKPEFCKRLSCNLQFSVSLVRFVAFSDRDPGVGNTWNRLTFIDGRPCPVRLSQPEIRSSSSALQRCMKAPDSGSVCLGQSLLQACLITIANYSEAMCCPTHERPGSPVLLSNVWGTCSRDDRG